LKALLLANTQNAEKEFIQSIPSSTGKSLPTGVDTTEGEVGEEVNSKSLVGRPDQVRELQDGWLECYTSEGFAYYFNQATRESLWNLPEKFKKPLHDEKKRIFTPRNLLTKAEAVTPPQTPRGIAFSKYHVDTKILLSIVAEVLTHSPNHLLTHSLT
jgi:hypothetical protein